MRRALLALSATLLFASCGRDTTEPEVFDPVGRLSFTYRGAITGTFSTAGQLELTADNAFSPVVGASAYSQEDQLALVASHAGASPQIDVFSLLLGDVQRTGSVSINAAPCAGGSLAQCRIGFFLPEIDATEWTGPADLETIRTASYVMMTGDVTITKLTGSRVKGTFRGMAVRGTELSLLNTITISNGVFDLPLRAQ